jgi:hypothetical protein
MDRGAYFMNKRIYQLVIGVICSGTLLGCGEAVRGADIFTEDEAKQALRQLPYRYKFRSILTRSDADSVVAGLAIGPHGTRLHFGISFGDSASPVAVSGAGTDEVLGYRGDPPFIFTDDLQIRNASGKLVPGSQFQNARQWHEAGHMEVEMANALCKAETGEVCRL